MIKLVVSDLDGTLLRKDKQQLEPETLELVRKLQERGFLFVAASGRQYPNMYRLFGSVGDDMYFICENGSLLIHKGKVYKKNVITHDLGVELIKDILNISEAEALISGEATSYIIPKKQSFQDRMIHQVKNNVTVIDAPEQIQEEYIKISLFIEGIQRIPEDMGKYFRNKYSDKLQVVISGNEWLDFIPLDAGKGNTLNFLMNNLGITKEETIVFGDNENDITMLSLTPNSYVMSHSDDRIKQYGTMECRYVDDVLITLIEGSNPC